MGTLDYSDVTPKKVILWNGEPYEVLSSHVFRMQMRKPVNQTKLRNLKSGKVVEVSFHQNETIEEADIEYQNIRYLYTHKGEYWFCEEGNPRNRFQLSADMLGTQVQYLKADTTVEAMKFEEEIIGVHLPIKMDFVVTDAPPAIKGNTVSGGSKQVTLETGATINAPLFINTGDILRINTETGEYVERVEKGK